MIQQQHVAPTQQQPTARMATGPSFALMLLAMEAAELQVIKETKQQQRNSYQHVSSRHTLDSGYRMPHEIMRHHALIC